jgi:transglutaminase-like putative cysteine protease
MDFFGNLLSFFTIQEPHRELMVESRSEVVMNGSPTPWPEVMLPWEEAARLVPADLSEAGLEACQFGFESPRIRVRPEFAAYALESFTPGRSLPDALLDLTSRIHKEFSFDAKSTNVRTTPEEVFKKRRGVCQDFAHLQIACLRSLNLAARYVSGYLFHADAEKARAAQGASHAWVEALLPGLGWTDFDPH